MSVQPSKTFEQFKSYAFDVIDKARDAARGKGFEIIDFGVGDPTDALYEGSIKALQEGAEKHKYSGYPSYIGMPEFREAAAKWMGKRFGVMLTQIPRSPPPLAQRKPSGICPLLT